jgi:hypothetical protein
MTMLSVSFGGCREIAMRRVHVLVTQSTCRVSIKRGDIAVRQSLVTMLRVFQGRNNNHGFCADA